MLGWLAPITFVLAGFLVGFAWFPLPSVATRLISDDAYYYLIVGRNLSQGYFSAFDGGNLPSGYHPLGAVLLGGAAFVVRDRETLLRLSASMNLLSYMVAGRRQTDDHGP